MKIIYMGTPAFACPPLKALHESKHEIALVVTGPNKRSGRGKIEKPTEIAELAEQLNLKVIKPSSLRDETLFETIEQIQPDLIVVVAFRILPKRLFSLPKFGSINIHGSLLPKYRGAAPINWALVNGEKETGLSAFYLKQKVDTGDIISQVRISIDDKDNFDSLYNRLSETAAPFLLETIEQIESGKTNIIVQDESHVSNAPKITPFDALIDFGFPSVNVWNFVRGMSSRPGSYTFFRNKKLKILSCEPVNDYNESGIRPGTIINNKKKLIVQCADTAVELKQLIPDGKKEMDGVSFINGFRPKKGEVMGELPKESDFSK
jgi:methionyl-tRNA formyltransferase